MEIPIRNYAHLGDAVWEVIVREYTVDKTTRIETLHKLTTERVNAKAQHQLLSQIEDRLTDEEKELVRRARNLAVPVSRRNIQAEYRMATAFETLLGFWFVRDRVRFNEMKEVLLPLIQVEQ